MDIIAMTRTLGAEMQKDPRYLALQKAREDSDADEVLQRDIGRFNLLRMQLNEELVRDEKDQLKIDKLNQDLGACYADVMGNPCMTAYNAVKGELDALLRDVTAILTMCANGEDPATCEPVDCGGSCESCAGCS